MISTTIQNRATTALFAVLAALAVVFALFPTAVQAQEEPGDQVPEQEEEHEGTPTDVHVDRFEGTDRVKTAVDVSENTFETSEYVLIANGDRFPDALTGNYLAGVLDAPILLLQPEGNPTVPEEVWGEIERLEAETIIILGGVDAVPQRFEDEFNAAEDDYAVDRIGGDTRWETAALIATSDYNEDSPDTAILATGANFPDALASGQIAFSEEFPVLLTVQDELDPSAAAALEELETDRVLIAGGTAVISQGQEDELEEDGRNPERYAGDETTGRWGTAVKWAELAEREFGYTVEHVNVASGENRTNGADALAMGPHAGTERNPMILTPGESDDLSADAHQVVDEYLRERACTIRALHLAGGTVAISEANEAALVDAAEACVEDRATITLDQDQFVRGGEITGTIEGEDIANVAVAGDCIEDDEELVVEDDGTFAIPVPETADTGACTLTFTVTFEDGEEEVYEVTTTITAAAITLDASEAKPGDDITGAITDADGEALDNLESLTVAGECVEDGEVVVDETDGTFAVTISDTAEEGDCLLTFTVTFDDETATETHTFTITVLQEEPAFAGASATPGTTVTVTYDELIDCASVDADASNYEVTVDDEDAVATAAACVTPVDGASTEVEITLEDALVVGETVTVTAVEGGDGDTVVDADDNAQPVGDTVETVVEAPPENPAP